MESLSVDSLPVKGMWPWYSELTLYPHMTVYENIGFPLRVKNESKEKIDTEIKREAAFLVLNPLRRRPRNSRAGRGREWRSEGP
jgi:multiple sugar transport system ATP-binding protein